MYETNSTFCSYLRQFFSLIAHTLGWNATQPDHDVGHVCLRYMKTFFNIVGKDNHVKLSQCPNMSNSTHHLSICMRKVIYANTRISSSIMPHMSVAGELAQKS